MSRINDTLFEFPNCKFNVTTKERKDLLLRNEASFVKEGVTYDIKFKNLGGGVWEATSEKRKIRNHS